MQVEVEERADTLIVRPLFRRLDAAAAVGFRDQVAPRLGSQRLVVFDLGQIDFMDSSGLGSLISLLKRLPAGALVRLAQPKATIQTVLRLSRLDKVLPAFASLDLALA